MSKPGLSPDEERRPAFWGEKRYHSLDYALKKTFGEKVYRLSLNGGMTCPNRDGTLGTRGCSFCRYIAYFQAYTGTYAPVERLRALFTEAILHPDIAALSIATRCDCLPPDVLSLLKELRQIKPVWVELGLQSIHEETHRKIGSGFTLSQYENAVRSLCGCGIDVITHLIFGLPGETRDMMLASVSRAAALPIAGIKLQLLHLLKGTELCAQYEAAPFPLPSLEEYCDLIADALAILTGDGPRALLTAPLWSLDKKRVLNTIQRRLRERNLWQGKLYED